MIGLTNGQTDRPRSAFLELLSELHNTIKYEQLTRPFEVLVRKKAGFA